MQSHAAHGHAAHAHAQHSARDAVPPAVNGAPVYTCPMHPQIRQPAPGHCPICGMALEPVQPAPDDGPNPELVDFTRRFWWTLPLTVAVVLLAMAGHRVGWIEPLAAALAMSLSSVSVVGNALRLRRR